eukprot:SAG22_NODE_8514_length_649_cov_1.514545_2_plen_148_part_01
MNSLDSYVSPRFSHSRRRLGFYGRKPRLALCHVHVCAVCSLVRGPAILHASPRIYMQCHACPRPGPGIEIESITQGGFGRNLIKRSRTYKSLVGFCVYDRKSDFYAIDCFDFSCTKTADWTKPPWFGPTAPNMAPAPPSNRSSKSLQG